MSEDAYHKYQRLLLERTVKRVEVLEEKLSKRGRPPATKEKEEK